MGSARRIAIVGAGLGGLAAAIALRRQGFDVQVYEQAPELAEFGAGINLSPNSVKVFRALDLAAELHAVGSEPVGLTWRDWGSDTIHNVLPFVDFEMPLDSLDICGARAKSTRPRAHDVLRERPAPCGRPHRHDGCGRIPQSAAQERAKA